MKYIKLPQTSKQTKTESYSGNYTTSSWKVLVVSAILIFVSIGIVVTLIR